MSIFKDRLLLIKNQHLRDHSAQTPVPKVASILLREGCTNHVPEVVSRFKKGDSKERLHVVLCLVLCLCLCSVFCIVFSFVCLCLVLCLCLCVCV